MTKLSVNINKIAVLRNSRGGDVPNLLQVAKDCERFGAQGITVHPRPDERHIRYSDVLELKKIVTTELNIEGYPSKEFMAMVLKVKPEQVTLVPDPPEALTSAFGWDTIKHKEFLKEIVKTLKNAGIRSSIFVDPVLDMVDGACEIGCDRIEFYTESYARLFKEDNIGAIYPFIEAAKRARVLGLEINAGHDLSLENIEYLIQNIPFISEVSIGHALISEALYLGLEKTIKSYLKKISMT